MRLEYRADVDGLRAIAVLSVILFHAQYSLFAGGFVGVDVFFVISGYLITSIILKQDDTAGSFLKKFYEGRIRRLLPPVIPVLLVTSAFAYSLLSLEAMEEYTKSLVAFLMFISNWFFWDVAGYFDGPSHLKPLLHTWSLSVEEQFYIFFPVIALLLKRYHKSLLPAFILAVFIGSLSYNIYLVWNNDLNSAFFNSFGRFWEIALGSLLACGLIKSPTSAVMKNIVGATGLIVIVCCVFFLREDISFPGFWALFPTIGAAMVILAQGGVASKILAAKPLVGVGLISYALYLWHWPLFAFLNTYFISPRPEYFAVAIVATFILSLASYFFIERPVRFKVVMPKPRHALAIFLVSLSTFGALGMAGVVTEGFPSRLPGSAVDYEAFNKKQVILQRRAALIKKCWLSGNAKILPALDSCIKKDDDRYQVLLVGDSHAAHLYAGLSEQLPEASIKLLAVNSCSLSGNEVDVSRTACVELISYLDDIKSNKFDAIVLSTRAELEEPYVQRFLERVERLSKVSSVYVLGPIQFYKPNMPTIYSGSVGKIPTGQIKAKFDLAVQESQFRIDKIMRGSLANFSGVSYISLLDAMCPNKKCRHFDKEGWPILVDNSHLSLPASRELAEQIAGKLTFEIN